MSAQTMMTGRREFAQRLRDERERSGVALRTIADSTKIPMSLLIALERGEIDKWPSGLFGRAHLRAYAAAIGLPAEEVLVDFLRLSGETSKGIAPPRRVQSSAPDGSFRLTLADDRRGTRSSHLTRIFDRAWRAALFRRAAD